MRLLSLSEALIQPRTDRRTYGNLMEFGPPRKFKSNSKSLEFEMRAQSWSLQPKRNRETIPTSLGGFLDHPHPKPHSITSDVANNICLTSSALPDFAQFKHADSNFQKIRCFWMRTLIPVARSHFFTRPWILEERNN